MKERKKKCHEFFVLKTKMVKVDCSKGLKKGQPGAAELEGVQTLQQNIL